MDRELHEAMLWDTVVDSGGDEEKVRCQLCAHGCVIAPGAEGICRVRQNVGGRLKSLNYGLLVATSVDPIEKKPLFHFLPGSRSLSIASPGCNFQCDFCQNWRISQSPRLNHCIEGQSAEAEEIVAAAAEHDCASISYTYTEPTIFFEFAYDCAKAAGERGIRNCFVSNGYMTPRAVETIAPHLDAINVDLKAFREETYASVCKASLKPVLTCLEALVAAGVWVEVTTLVVPGMNDSAEELGDIAGYIAGNLGRHVPWHVSRFHGDYKRPDASPTPMDTLEMACCLGSEAGLQYVYCGNVTGQADERTKCPSCGEVVIERSGFTVERVSLTAGKCGHCGQAIEGVWAN